MCASVWVNLPSGLLLTSYVMFRTISWSSWCLQMSTAVMRSLGNPHSTGYLELLHRLVLVTSYFTASLPPRVSHLPSPSHAGPPQRATGMKKRRDGRGCRDGASWTMATICIIGICITLDLTCVSFATSAGINHCQQNHRECHILSFRDRARE